MSEWCHSLFRSVAGISEKNYPGFYFVSSTTKVLTDFEQFVREVNREEFLYVVPDFRLNKVFDKLSTLTGAQKDKVEFLCNECCWFGCGDRKICYEAVSRKNLGENGSDHRCAAPDAGNGYRFSKAMENPGFIGVDDMKTAICRWDFPILKSKAGDLAAP